MLKIKQNLFPDKNSNAILLVNWEISGVRFKVKYS